MKRAYAIAALLVMMPLQSQAKVTSTSVPSLFPQFGPGSSMLHPGFYQSRLIGQSYGTFTNEVLEPFDSITYSYSFGRGGELSREELDDHYVNFEESITYRFNPLSQTYVRRHQRVQTYNQFGKVAYYTCRNWRPVTSSWDDSARFVYSYNTDNTLLLSTVFQIMMNVGWMDHVPYDNVYDPVTGKLMEMNSLVFQMKFVYDINGNLIERKERTRSLTTPWKDTEKHLFTYDTNDRVITYIVQINDGGWKNTEKTEYTYNGSLMATAVKSEWEAGAWSLKGKHEYTYDSNNNKISDTWLTWDAGTSSWNNTSRLEWTYNGFDQPLTHFSRTWDEVGSNWVFADGDFLKRFHYQSYNPNSVATVKEAVSVSSWPQPATDQLNFNLTDRNLSDGTVLLSDLQGRVVKTQPLQSGTQQTINVTDIPSGYYVLNILAGTERYTTRVLIAH